MKNINPRVGRAATASEIRAGYAITSEQLHYISRLNSLEAVSAAVLVEAFYAWLRGQPWMKRFFPDGVPEGVQVAQVRYWDEFLTGTLDDAYILSRLSVGATHARIDLPPVAYTSAMAFCQRWLISQVRKANLDASATLGLVEAISLLCQLDSALVMDAYADHSRQQVEAQGKKLLAVHEEMTRVVVSAGEGNFRQRYRSQDEDDAPIGEAVNSLLENLQNTIGQVGKIADGDYSQQLAPRSERDELGHALSKLTKQLRDATETTRKDQWLKQGQADIFERMRGELTTDELAGAVLPYLAKRLDVQVGCVYVVEDDKSLRLSGTYGISEEEVPSKVRKGGGILGEVVQANEPMWDLDISSSPISASFGVGSFSLTHAALVPLSSAGQVEGVVQLASLSALKQEQIELLEQTKENIAIGLGGARARTRMQVLLENSQKQGDEMQSQAEELRASNEELAERGNELEVTRRDVERQNNELQTRQAEIESTQVDLERRAEELAMASKYKTQFLANMSHELRTPLNSMLILTGNLCDNPEENLTSKQLEALRLVKGGGDELLRLINDILDLSKVEAGKLSIEVVPVQLEALLRSLRDQFNPVAAERGLELSFEAATGLPPDFESDPQRVEQVLKNLLSNALKFTSAGSVRLHVRFATPAELSQAGLDPAIANLSLAVTDTGIGIATEQQEAIFGAFQQADGSTSRTYGGTGLGLAISQQLAGLLGGKLQVRSQTGKGSTFSLLLPVQGEATKGGASSGDPGSQLPGKAGVRFSQKASVPANDAAPESEEADSRVRTGNPTLMIVEDDPGFAQILSSLARDHGYQVTLARTGKEALIAAQQQPPEGILLDLGLPDIDGTKVLEQLKSNIATRHIPVHVVSGHDCRPAALKLGAMGFLQKPVDQQSVDSMFTRFEKLWSRQTGRVLVVEDDKASRAAIRSLLAGRDVTLVAAETGAEGLKHLAEGEFDCLVVDLGLPDMDGMEFLSKLGAEHPPVVIYTAEELTDARLQELSNHTDSVVLKGAQSPARLLDEVSLFLHQVGSELSAAQQALLGKIHNQSNSLEGRKVLVVDDDVRNVFAMTELLQRHGVEVLKAKNGQVALDQLEAHADINLVLMDLMMPVMDGLEATRRIRSLPQWAELPIIVVTAKTLPEDRQACMESGASDYLTKPMDVENMLALMRVLLFDVRRADGARTDSRGVRSA